MKLNLLENILKNRRNKYLWILITTLLIQGIITLKTTTVNAQIDNPSESTTETDRTPNLEPWRRARLKHILTGHTSSVDSVIFSPDSELLFSGGNVNDPEIRLWSVDSGELLEDDSLKGHPASVLTMAITPDGKTLVSSGEDSVINIWDLETMENKGIFLEHNSSVLSVAITPDSRSLVSGGLDGIRVWSLTPQRPLYILDPIGNPAYSIAVHPNGYIIASGDGDGNVRFWDLRRAQLVSDFTPHGNVISSLIFTPDGKSLISTGFDRDVKVWDLATGELKILIENAHSDFIRAMALHPNGKTLATASNDGVRLWNIETGEFVTILNNGHQDWVQALAFSPDGNYLACGSFDSSIQIWEEIRR